ncbi:TolC family protein [Massilia norwichensis]|uniref:TolC family protein n=1 Tax=Massilia norwichensis TaxID=1442366 RepID=A0ABT2A7Y9_9BURK|nr:TolC family protein [Massilia norwichensis]MCS0590315.1 TolC family protein [Massilia norwichensis]
MNLKMLGAPLALAVLAGCSTVAPGGGFDSVAAGARDRIGVEPRLARDDAAARELAQVVETTLAKPLGMDDAVKVAVLAHPGLQASYWKVGIAQADLVQAGRLPNPVLDYKHVGNGGGVAIERTFTVNLVRLLTLPLASRLEAQRFEQARLEVAREIEQHARDTRIAWVEAVAANQALEYARQVDAAAEASAELAGRMAKVGNMSQLDLSREQLYHAETQAALALAGKEAVASREKLTRLLGLWGKDAQYSLPEHLPELPAAPAQLRDIERIAIEQRLDVQAAKLDAQATAANLGLTKATRFVNVLDLGYVNESDSHAPTARGYELSLELPLFDWGGARTARAEGVYMQALQRVAQAAVTARSEARESYLGYRTAFDVAAHYRDTIIPLRKKISKEVLLRYNGMLLSTQDLLADSRDQADAVSNYIDALKEFWTAHASLEAALGVRLGGDGKAQHVQHEQNHEEHAE